MPLVKVFVFCLIEAMLCDSSHEKSLGNHSQNIVVAVGGNVTLECRVNPNDSISWFLTTVNNAQAELIFTSTQANSYVQSTYRINRRSSGQFDLIIDSVDRRLAGKYYYKLFGSTTEFTTYLTVIDKEPICGINAADSTLKENDQVSIWCEVNSTGFLKPIMKWTKGNVIIASSTKNTIAINGSVTTTSNTILQLQSKDHNVTIQCTTSFQWPNGSQENIPQYRHGWQYLARAQYGVRNITIEPNASSFKYGDQLKCLADGNPNPTYTWTPDDTSNYRQYGSVLTLTNSLLVGTKYLFECTAQNTVDGKIKNISKSVSIYINAHISSSNGNEKSTSLIAAYIGGATSFVIILLIILSVFCRTKTKTWLIMRFSSLQRKFSRDPDVLPRESSSRDVYAAGSVYPTPYSDVYHEINDQPRFQIADVPLRNENQAAARDSQSMDFRHGLQMGIPHRATSKNRLVGADGTEYLDFAGVASSGAKKVRKGSPTYKPVETYAMIDHCNLAPPLPPKKY